MAEQLFQIATKALIKNKDSKVLLVHIPEWGDNPKHWDLPGGRMEPGETFEQTLKREIKEEIGIDFTSKPKQVLSVLSNLVIPVGNERIPLVIVIYEVLIPSDSLIRLDPDSVEDAYDWFTPVEAADHLGTKYSSGFCDYVRDLEK